VVASAFGGNRERSGRLSITGRAEDGGVGAQVSAARPTDRRACDPYDIDFGRWIPERALDALRAAVVLSHPGGQDAVAVELEPWARVPARETRADDD
jgi:hypothetical protein